RGKTGDGFVGLDQERGVDERRARRQPGNGGGDVWKFFAPIEALAGEQADFAVVEPSLDAVAVKLDLVRPARPARGRRAQGCKRRRHEVRQSRAARPPLLVLGAVLAAFLRGGRLTRAALTLRRAFSRARAPRGG